MNEVCPFKDDCPVMTEIREISGACSGRMGEKCGPVGAYTMLIFERAGLVELDKTSSIVGTFRIEGVPGGIPPVFIRRQWPGVEVPIRRTEKLTVGIVVVEPADVILSLFRDGKFEASTWFAATEETEKRHSIAATRWTFKANEGGTIRFLRAPTTSINYYSSALREGIVAQLDNLHGRGGE